MAHGREIEDKDTRYRDGTEQGMKGTIIPSARAQANKEDSGVRFDPHKAIPHNIVEVDMEGRTVSQRRLTQEGLDKLRAANTNQKHAVMGYEDVVAQEDVSEPASAVGDLPMRSDDVGVVTVVEPGSEPKTVEHVAERPDGTWTDASVPSTEETVPSSHLRHVKEEMAQRAEDPTPAGPITVVDDTVAQAPPRRDDTPRIVEPVPEPVPQVTTKASAVPAVIPAYHERREKPADLDLEPDPSEGPRRIASYAVPLRQSTEETAPIPIIKPAQMPSRLKEAPPPEQLAKLTAEVNLDSEPMTVARVKVRFRGDFGKLAVPYNLVFVHDYQLICMQYSADGSFYEPPGEINKHIEIQWHGMFFMCFPGPYFIMPDQQMSFAIFLIDDAATAELRRERDNQD